MQEVRVVTINEEFEALQKGRGPDKKPRKKRWSAKKGRILRRKRREEAKKTHIFGYYTGYTD